MLKDGKKEWLSTLAAGVADSPAPHGAARHVTRHGKRDIACFFLYRYILVPATAWNLNQWLLAIFWLYFPWGKKQTFT